jgi:norsolorinic acid ketoreductase
MAENFVVFITGVNRGTVTFFEKVLTFQITHLSGIGNSLATAYLLQPNCTVIGSVRDDATPEVTELKSVPKGDGSLLYLVEIESSNPASVINAVSQIQAARTNHIDILIANAAVSPPIEPIETVSLETMADTYSVNTLGPLAVYQACYAMLKNSKREPKFVTVTSAAGSIAGMASGSGTFVAPAYCVSKAGLNWITLYVVLFPSANN